MEVIMVQDVTMALVSILLLLASFAMKPTSVRCPDRWYLNGVRPDGELGCRPIPARHPGEEGPPYRFVVGDPWEDLELTARVYCTGGSKPIVVAGDVAGCSR